MYVCMWCICVYIYVCIYIYDIYLARDVKDTFDPTCLTGCCRCNPIQPCFSGEFMIYLEVI